MATEFLRETNNVLGSSVVNCLYVTNSGACNFDVAPRNLENLCASGLKWFSEIMARVVDINYYV